MSKKTQTDKKAAKLNEKSKAPEASTDDLAANGEAGNDVSGDAESDADESNPDDANDAPPPVDPGEPTEETLAPCTRAVLGSDPRGFTNSKPTVPVISAATHAAKARHKAAAKKAS